MLEHNVGNVDRAVRIILAAGLFSLFYFLPGAYAYLGLIGLVPLITAIAGTCPIYSMLGMSTCPVAKAKA
ncbi:MAG: DUF2892 domain-containing protein [Sandaracinaceae bacterium]